MKDNYYFDNAATSWPKPEVVYTTMDQFFRNYGVNPGRAGHELAVEAEKMIEETRKVFHQPNMAITATCVRVPVERAHSEAVNLTFEKPITPIEVREVLSSARGVEVVDDVARGRFPMPIDASGQDNVLVGRIRQDVSQPDGRGIELFLSGDQLRKGAALNAVQILELITA